MQHAGIEPEIATQLVQQIFEDTAVAAVAVDDREIARRQRPHDRRREIAHLARVSRHRQASVPAAQSCSRDSPIESVGSCHRSNASPQRCDERRVTPSAMTTRC